MSAVSPRVMIVVLLTCLVVGLILLAMPFHGEYKWDPDNPDRASIESRMLELGKDYDVASAYAYDRYGNAMDRVLIVASGILTIGSIVGGVVYGIWVDRKSRRTSG